MSNSKASAGTARPRNKKRQTYMDYQLLAVVILLITFGLIMLYSASSYEGYTKQSDDMYYFMRQAVFFMASIVGVLLVSRVDYHILVRLAPGIYLLAFGLMALVPIVGIERNGAKRWLGTDGGLSFQPSEIAKIALILALASMIVSFGKKIAYKRNLFWLVMVILILFIGAFQLTDNLSTGVIILGIGAGIMLIYYPDMKQLIFLALIVIAAVALVLLYLKYFADPDVVSNDFRLARVYSWLNRESDSSDGSFQVLQGLYAIGSGGFFGKGLGNSAQKITRIPEAQNDMIFAVICEELGLFGAILLLILFGYLLYRLFYIAQNAPDLYGSVIATGVMLHLAIQIILNIAVVLNLIPTTGISLPFVSYGGTAIIFLMGEIGVCLNISRQIRFRKQKTVDK
ncbi:MAG: FtsW/RodA/SpoVE family cell cycle protein [Lachnospiraceae bacterium]|nr:FtsW/RodA/SpoVE family cell cycle protein [Lachnospiraceae bacterium]